VGKVTAVAPSHAEVLTSDRGVVSVITQQGGAPLSQNQTYELLCHINAQGQVYEQGRHPFNSDFDLDAYNEVVRLSQTQQVRCFCAHI